ncbi:hypothetical protein HDE_03926 [Halotydeus destructor]|nr:hypothetical protein HDE_03926 [Halotydeus destructor]
MNGRSVIDDIMRPRSQQAVIMRDEPVYASRAFSRTVQEKATMTNAKPILRVIELLISAICLIGGVVQFLIILKRYFDYPININTRLTTSQFVQLPAISLCLSYGLMLDKLESFYPNIYRANPNRKATDTSWDEILTVKQYEETSVSRSDLIAECYVAYLSNKTMCTNWAGPVYMKYEYKCFTNFDTDQQIQHGVHKPYRLEDISNTRWTKVRFVPQERFHSLNYFAVGIHPRYKETFPDMGSRAFYEFKQVQPERIAFTYTMTRSLYLEAPYRSRCINYSRDGAPTYRKKLVNACAAATFFNVTGRWPRDIFYVHKKEFAEARFSTDKEKKHSYFERYNCIKLYQWPDCLREDLLMEVKSVLDNGGNSTELVLYPPTEPYLLVEQEPSFELLDLLSYGSGILGLWLGFSLAGMGSYLVGYLHKALGKVSRKSRRRPTESLWVSYNAYDKRLSR